MGLDTHHMSNKNNKQHQPNHKKKPEPNTSWVQEFADNLNKNVTERLKEKSKSTG